MEDLLKQFAQRVNGQFLWGYRMTALILALYHGFLAGHRFLRPEIGHATHLLAWEALVCAALYLAIFAFAPRVSTSGRHVEDLGALVVLGAMFNAVFLMAALPQAVQTTNFMLVQVGSGMALRSRLRFLLVQVLNLAGWVALFLRVEPETRPDHWIFAIASGVILAVAFHMFLRHAVAQLEFRFLQKELVLRQRERLIRGLRQSLAEVRTLRGLLPICAHCKRIRDNAGSWHTVEHYLAAHSDATFTHGICPECSDRLLREWQERRSPGASGGGGRGEEPYL